MFTTRPEGAVLLSSLFSILLYSLIFLPGAAVSDIQTLRLATTTSTENSGLLRELLPRFEKVANARIHVIAVGTGKALELGRRGDVDAVLVHARQAEDEFVKSGYGVRRYDVMYNDFVVVGPKDDPANVRGMHDAVPALKNIASSEGIFISRGDGSGTHKKEMGFWKQAGLIPEGQWYRSVGQGMGKTLQIAGEMDAYTLVDRGTWLAYQGKSPLVLQVEGGIELRNPYGIIAVNPEHYPYVNYPVAQRFIDWLIAPDQGQHFIKNYRINGEQLFHPAAD